MHYENLAGTTSEEFSLGKGSNRSAIRTSSAELEYLGKDGEWHKIPHSPNVDGGRADTVYFVRPIDGGDASG